MSTRINISVRDYIYYEDYLNRLEKFYKENYKSMRVWETYKICDEIEYLKLILYKQ